VYLIIVLLHDIVVTCVACVVRSKLQFTILTIKPVRTVELGFKLVIPRCSSVGCVPTAGLDALPSTTPYIDMQGRSECLA